MFENIIFLSILIVGMLVVDVPNLKKSNRRERIIYLMMMLPVLYLSLIFVMDVKWPNLDEFVHSIFSKPAQQIVESIKSSK